MFLSKLGLNEIKQILQERSLLSSIRRHEPYFKRFGRDNFLIPILERESRLCGKNRLK